LSQIHEAVPIKTVDLTTKDVNGDHAFVGVGGNRGQLRDRLGRWAEKRKQKHKAYVDPAEMTWRRVSRTMDRLLFRFFLLLVVVSNIVLWAFLIKNYYSVSKTVVY
jgi:hypothetical protein